MVLLPIAIKTSYRYYYKGDRELLLQAVTCTRRKEHGITTQTCFAA